MKRKNKVALAIVLVAIIAGGISWTLIKKNNAKKDCDTTNSANSNGECKVDLSSIQSSVSSTPSVSLTSIVSATATSEFLYRNDRYGFELALNPAWRGYTVGQQSDEKVEGIYDINIPTKDSNIPSGIAVPLTIKIFTKENYPTGSNLTKITENSKYIFAYSIWSQSPSDSSITEKDIANVISTFKLN